MSTLITPAIKTCSNCAKVTPKLATGRCDACYRWFKKHGVERRVNLHAEVVDEQVQEAAAAQVEPEPQAEVVVKNNEQKPQAPVTELPTSPTAVQDVSQEVVTSSPLADKVQYLLSLAAQGEQALQEALRTGMIQIRVPREQKAAKQITSKAKAPVASKAGKGAKILARFTSDVITAVRADRATGMAYSKLEEKYSITPDKGRTAWTICNCQAS